MLRWVSIVGFVAFLAFQWLSGGSATQAACSIDPWSCPDEPGSEVPEDDGSCSLDPNGGCGG